MLKRDKNRSAFLKVMNEYRVQGRLSQGGLGEQSPTFSKVGGVEGLVISTNMTLWRLDRQTDTRKAAISDISEYTYDAKVTYFYRLLLVVTLGIPVMPRVNRDLKLIQMCMFL